MPETLSQQRVRVHASPLLTSDPPGGIQHAEPAFPVLSVRIKRLLKNPLVLVGITWVVMAALLAREILVR